MLGFLGGFSVYHAVVLPSIFVVGPVLMLQEYDGARSWALVTALFGLGNILGDVLLLSWRPPHALRVGALMLIGASCQAAIIGSHLPVWGIGGLELLTGDLRHRHVHALGDLARRAHPAGGAVAGVELRLPVDAPA